MSTPAQTWKCCCRFFERPDVRGATRQLGWPTTILEPDLPLFVVERLATGERLGVSAGRTDIFEHNPFDAFAGIHRNLAFSMTGGTTKQFTAFVVGDVAFMGTVDTDLIGRPGGAEIRSALVLHREQLRVVAEPGRHPMPPGQREELQAAIIVMLQCLGTVNLPTNAIVRSDAQAPAPKSTRVPRLSQRPIYIPQERSIVEQRWHAAHGPAAVMPHWRRGHWRVLKDPKYGDKVGSRIWVRPTRVGEPDLEWSEAGTRYVVVA